MLTRQTLYLTSKGYLLKCKSKIRKFSSDLWSKSEIYQQVYVCKIILYLKKCCFDCVCLDGLEKFSIWQQFIFCQHQFSIINISHHWYQLFYHWHQISIIDTNIPPSISTFHHWYQRFIIDTKFPSLTPIFHQ